MDFTHSAPSFLTFLVIYPLCLAVVVLLARFTMNTRRHANHYATAEKLREKRGERRRRIKMRLSLNFVAVLAVMPLVAFLVLWWIGYF